MISGLRALLLAAVLAAVAAPAAARPTEEAFTREMAERVRAALPGREVSVAGPLQLRVSLGTGEPAEINVGRIFNYCASATEDECEAAAAHFATALTEGLTERAPVTRAQLRVALRASEFCDELGRIAREEGGGAEAGPLTRAGPPGLCAVMMADYPTIMRGVRLDDLAALGLGADEAWPLAERQTLANLPEPQALGEVGGITAVTDFDYIPSLLLNAEGWRAAAARGEILVAVPADNLMIVARAAAIGDMAGLRQAVRESFDTAQRGISPLIYRWTERGWAVAD